MVLLNSCCCCVSLRTGALTIAILYLTVNIGMLLGWFGYTMANLAAYNSEENDIRASRIYSEVWFGGVMFGILLIPCGINITMDSLLVHGIRRNVRKFILPWVVWYGIVTSLITLAMVGVEIWLLVMHIEAWGYPHENSAILVGPLIVIGCIAAISLPILWYWYACVASYYAVLAPSDVYVMESLHDDDGNPESDTPGYRPVDDAD